MEEHLLLRIMSEALNAADAHIRAIEELSATAEEKGFLDDSAFYRISIHQREWESEMEKYRTASASLAKLGIEAVK